MDVDGSLNISYDEWRDFLMLAPSTDIRDLLKFWRHSTVSIMTSIKCNASESAALLHAAYSPLNHTRCVRPQKYGIFYYTRECKWMENSVNASKGHRYTSTVFR